MYLNNAGMYIQYLYIQLKIKHGNICHFITTQQENVIKY